MNKKGDVMAIIVLIVVLAVTVLFFAGFQYAFGELTSIMKGTNINVLGANTTEITGDTFEMINNGLGGLKWVAFAIFVAMALSIFISSFLVKAHPVFFIIYLCITVVAVVLSIPISNAYEEIISGMNPIAATLQTYGPINYVMLHLPVFVVIIGMAGALFLFIGVTVDRESGGSIM